MKNKKIIILMLGIITLLVGLVVYGYYNVHFPQLNKNHPTVIEKNGPTIIIESPLFDFGTVVYGDVAEHNFIVKNTGTENLEILRLSTSCGCTKAFIDEEDKIIAPHESIKIRVTFDPAVHKDETDLGDLTRIIYVKTNDVDNPEVEATIKAHVIKK